MQTECVPVDYQILTRRGWLEHDQVRPGDETIGYNPATGRSQWTTITAVHHYGNAATVRYGNRYWSAECTPDHRWLTERVARRPVGQRPGTACPDCGATGSRRGPFRSQRAVQIHRAREHGKPGDRHGAPTAEVITGTALLPLRDMTPQDRIVLARKADTAGSLGITTREAALLGWVAGDGGIDRRSGALSVYQSKRQFFNAIDYACGADPRHRRYAARPGRGRGWKDQVQWHLTAAYSRDLTARAGHPRHDAVGMVLAMSTEQRDAWLEAMLLAEGGWSDGKIVYFQNAGEVADAIELAVYLSGNRPARSERSRQNRVAVQITETAPHVGGPSRRATLSSAPAREVWCPTTELGSWTARSGGAGIFLTGNSGGNDPLANIAGRAADRRLHHRLLRRRGHRAGAERAHLHAAPRPAGRVLAAMTSQVTVSGCYRRRRRCRTLGRCPQGGTAIRAGRALDRNRGRARGPRARGGVPSQLSRPCLT